MGQGAALWFVSTYQTIQPIPARKERLNDEDYNENNINTKKMLPKILGKDYLKRDYLGFQSHLSNVIG